LSFIAEFVSEIRYIAGGDNTVADTLSRPPSSPSTSTPSASTPSPSPPSVDNEQQFGRTAAAAAVVQPTPSPPVSVADIAALQRSCRDCCTASESKVLRVQQVLLDGCQLLVDTSSGVLRPLVPAALRRRLFDSIHGLAHPGIRATTRLISSRFLWPKLASDVAAWCRDCTACQAAKVTKQHKAAVVNFPNTASRFTAVHVDIVGPLPQTTEGFMYLLTVVDRATRWLEALPLRGVTAAECAEAFIAGWVA
jgi:hypothetical protein